MHLLFSSIKHFSIGLLILGGLAACDSGGDSSSTEIPVATAPAESQAVEPSSAVLTFASQAESGAALYASNCAVCHGADLQGTTSGPLLSGFSFVQRWGGQTPALLLGNIQANMPPGGSGSLTDANYLDKSLIFLV